MREWKTLSAHLPLTENKKKIHKNILWNLNLTQNFKTFINLKIIFIKYKNKKNQTMSTVLALSCELWRNAYVVKF